MPTYVYKFTDTGETIEVQQAFTDPSLTEAVHPTSGKTLPVKKVFTPVGVTFKGGGFYKTDSRGGGSAAKPASAGESSNGSSTSEPSSTASSGSASSGDSSSGSSTAGNGSPASSAATSAATGS